MKTLYLSVWSYAGGGQRWLQTMLRYIPGRVIFTRMGHRGCLFHWLLRDHVEEDLCYRFGEASYPQDLAAYIDDQGVERLFVDNDERLAEVRKHSHRLRSGACKVIFVVHTECRTTGHIEKAHPWKVVCVSKRTREMLRKLSPTLIHNGVDQPPERGFNVRAFMDIPPDAAVIGYIGRMDGNKNVGMILDLLRRTELWALLVGAAIDVPANVADRVRIFPAEVINVGDWYRAMDVFALPSLSEGFPLGPMEALLCGCRVAMTPVSDFPQEFGGAVSFFEPGSLVGMRDAVLAAPDPSFGKQLVERRFSGQRMAEDYRRLMACTSAC